MKIPNKEKTIIVIRKNGLRKGIVGLVWKIIEKRGFKINNIYMC